MKKLFSILMMTIIMAAVIPLAACKKKQENLRTFEKYFDKCFVNDNLHQTTYTTKSIFERNSSVYQSMKFLANNDWTEDFFAEKLIIDFVASDSKDVDMIIIIETNGKKIEKPLLVQFIKNKTSRHQIEINTKFIGETSITLKLSNPGKNGTAGDLFNADGLSNGFVWKTKLIKLYGNH